MTEDDRIARLRARFADANAPGVVLAIGDDAAILAPPADEKLVWTIDAHVEDVHFRRAWLSFDELGWKSFMAAASDLGAMGARPLGALSALTLPENVSDADLDALAEGQARAARAIGTSVVGGNLSKGALSITTTLTGATKTPLVRTGAREGDLLLVSGELGLAAAGLALLMRGSASNDPRSAACSDAWKTPRARIEEGRAIAGLAHACMDVSDGLALDLARMCEASGVAASIDEALLLAHAGSTLADVATALGTTALDLALYGGEDYALLAAAPSELPGFTVIGRFVARSPEHGSGVSLARASGEEVALARRGFSHF